MRLAYVRGMSVEVTFYLEGEPSFESLVESFDENDDDRPSWANELEHRPDEGVWTFEAMVLEVGTYRPQSGDPIHRTTYRDKVRWTIEAHGRPGDQWVDFSEDVCRRWRGVVYLHATGEIWSPAESKAAPPAPPTDPAPISIESLPAMFDAAFHDPAVFERLMQGGQWDDHVAAMLIARARDGGDAGPFAPTLSLLDLRAPELEREDSRKELASRGPLAAAIVRQWEHNVAEWRQRQAAATAESARRAEQIEEMQERRRRGGEIHVQLPADIETIALTDTEQAVRAYAKRYRVPEPTARAVVERNTSKRDS